MSKFGIPATPKNPSLIFCIIMDAIGCVSYLLPGGGEVFDFIWAPISALIFYKTFGGRKGAFGALFNFAEEILPFTDFIPTFTIVWAWQYFTKKKELNQGSLPVKRINN